MMLKEITKLPLKVNLDSLRHYYTKVDTEFQQLRWNVGSRTITDDRGVGGHRIKDMYGWAIETNAKDINQPCPPYNIGLEKTDDYKDTALVFDIIHRFKKIFPFAHGYSLAAHPPGTYINWHVDSGTWLKIHVPIYTCANSWFNFKDSEYNLKADGSMYLIDTTKEHSTNNLGDDIRVHLIFKIPYEYHTVVSSIHSIIE